MAINEASLAAQYRAANRQNPKIPFLINIHDGRLVPNVPRLAGRPERRDSTTNRLLQAKIDPHIDYRPYRGRVDATREERMQLLRTEYAPMTEEIKPVGSEAPFDVATADAPALVEFALQQYGMNLSPNTPIQLLRGRVKALANDAGDLA